MQKFFWKEQLQGIALILFPKTGYRSHIACNWCPAQGYSPGKTPLEALSSQYFRLPAGPSGRMEGPPKNTGDQSS
jgi:hypothetical protein